MATFVQPRLVKITSASTQGKLAQAKPAQKPARQQGLGTRFLGFLLSALSAPNV
jgi:hypothetical protein